MGVIIMMDIDQTQRRDIDDIQNDKVSLTIDNYNLLSSPFSKDLYDYMVDGYNWIKLNDKIIKYNLVENDKLVFHIDKIDELIEKYITNIKIEFDIDTGNNNFIFDGVNLIHNDIIKNKSFHVFMSNRHMDFDCDVFDYNDLDFIVNGKGFDIELLFNGNKSNSTLSLKNIKIVFTFYEKLQNEKDTIYNRIEKEILDKTYPIGSIYMSINNTNPSELFGGTWEQIKDTFLLACGDTYQSDGADVSTAQHGSATVSLTESQMPRHNHTQNSHSHTPNGDYDYFLATPTDGGAVTRNSTAGQTGTKVQNLLQSTSGVSRTNTNAATPTIKYTGGNGSSESASNGASHENMPPYIACYMWKRTA